ncbi:MAG: hypothetical protein HY725_19105 [Candidatus Rokubacteria bacterium]|nr:hypothetical protein [Candidatus Rokubacteria bacterium]
MSVLAVCKDLFFTTRIEETGKLVGAPVEFVRRPDELAQKLAGLKHELVIVDLTTPGWDYHALFTALERHDPRPPILGFTTHALAKATQPWHPRCDRVVTKETLTRELADILARGLAARPAPRR